MSGYIELTLEEMNEWLELRPGLKTFWTHCENFLSQGVSPTPKLLNNALGRDKRRSLNGDECRIRTNLMNKYGWFYSQAKRVYVKS